MVRSFRLPAVSVITAVALAFGGVVSTSAAPTTETARQAAAIPEVTPSDPFIIGTPKVGRRLEVDGASWGADVGLDIQWYADGKPIDGGWDSYFTPTASHVGKRITVSFTGIYFDEELEDWVEVGTRTSKPTAKVAKGTLVAKTPVVSGSARVGTTLVAVPGSWTKGTKFTYQWLSNGKTVKGATKSTFTLTKARLGDKLSVKVTGKKAGYTTVAKKSKTTSAVKKAVWPSTEYGDFAPKTITGRGDDYIKLPAGAKTGVIVATHSGTSNFILKTETSSGGYGELLANEIGRYKGTTAFGLISWDRGKSKYLEVTADGAWTIKVLPMSKVPTLPTSGKGPGVYKYTTKSAKTRVVKHAGTSNFLVRYHHDGSFDTLVNEIGSYSGKKRFVAGPGIVEIDADGKWVVK